ncbi:MAG: GNAT family N-acetyltransferase, partial [Pseudomonadota bacterium]
QPYRLLQALKNSDRLECAYRGSALVGLANAISDGHLVVYYPHLLVLPDMQGTGVGRALMQRMAEHYKEFHQQTLLAVSEAAGFYRRIGFVETDAVVPMWIYDGDDH